jgi:hypothetical protein
MRRNRRLSVEALEDRRTPAGLVTATFMGATLVLTGDAADNDIEITQGTNDRLTLTGNAGTLVRLNAGPSLAALTLPAPTTANVAAFLGAGADNLTVTGVDFPGPLGVNAGDGANTLTLQGGVTVHGGLAFTNGTGIDSLRLFGAVTVTGGLTATNGAGGSILFDDSTTDLEVTGALTINNGAGADTVRLSSAARIAVGRILINHGTGADANITDVSPVGPLTVATGVRVTGGAGSDNVTLGGSTVSVGGSIALLHGAGGSVTRIASDSGLFVGGTVAVTALGGNDSVDVLAGLGSTTAIGGSVTVSVGDGGSSISVAGDRLVVGGSVTVAAGAGRDSLNLITATSEGAIGGDVIVGLGTGDNQVVRLTAPPGMNLTVGGALRATTADATVGSGTDLIDLFEVRVGRDTVLTLGAGGDIVSIENSSFAGPFTLATGAGNDDVQIERGGTTGTTRFRGAVRVGTGDGNDTVAVGNSNPGIDQAVFAMGNMWDGGLGTTDSLTIMGTSNVFSGFFPVVTGFESAS